MMTASTAHYREVLFVKKTLFGFINYEKQYTEKPADWDEVLEDRVAAYKEWLRKMDMKVSKSVEMEGGG